MAIFDLTFRIHNDGTYEVRYNSVIEAIQNLCQGEYWDRPSSYFLFENPSTAAKIAEYIEAKSQFAPAKDLLLVTNLSVRDYASIGTIKNDPALARLMAKR